MCRMKLSRGHDARIQPSWGLHMSVTTDIGSPVRSWDLSEQDGAEASAELTGEKCREH
jgi:hypothetical protein